MTRRFWYLPAFLSLILLLVCCPAASAEATDAAAALVKRIVPAQADQIDLQIIPADANRDLFEIESVGDRIVLRGNNGVSIATALGWYLKYDCHCQMSWCGDNLNLAAKLPAVPAKVRIVTPFANRVYFNFCTFSYSAPFWDWNRWQREIDWMALHGINMPLAITGEEAVWQNLLRKYGMNEQEIHEFLCGPAFFAWEWMANLEGWGGPLPQSWIDSHLELGRLILARERELGMTPILPGFTGFVPRKLATKFPAARIAFKPRWCGVFEGAAQLDPLDPLFKEIGKSFVQEQTRLLGTDHWYTADPFHESAPPSTAPTYMPAVARTILQTMQSADPEARIAMQTWSMREPIVRNIPEDKILLLDLEGHKWSSNAGFWERPWVRGVLQNFGGRAFLGGDVPGALTAPAALRKNPKAGRLTGVGLFPEAIEQNPVFYDAALEAAWHETAPPVDQWLADYAHARYRSLPQPAADTWKILGNSVYHGPQGSLESVICLAPSLAPDQSTFGGDLRRGYAPAAIWQAWTALQSASPELAKVDTYQYDLVDVGRQCLSDLSVALQHDISKAYAAQNTAAMAAASAKFLDLAADMDTLLGTRREFLLGRWLEDARRWGTNDDESKLYEQNARWQITVWGPDGPGACLSDYSNRQWSGLISSYYIPRWRKFLDFVGSQPNPPDPVKRAAFNKELIAWEYRWCDSRDDFPVKPTGDPIATSARLLAKWQPVAAEIYQRFDLRSLRGIGTDAPPLKTVKITEPAWKPADCSRDFEVWELDASRWMSTTAHYEVEFNFSHGAHALKIESVELLQKNMRLAIDTHDGWTGNESHGNSYRLDAGGIDPKVPVILRAVVATDGGTQSFGTIRIQPRK